MARAVATWKPKLEELRVAMARLDLNQRELAEKSGVSSGMVNKLLNGKLVLTRTAADVARVFERPVEELFEVIEGPATATKEA